MEKQPIPLAELALPPFTAFEPHGVLLVGGSGPTDANPMTISWGMFGIMWARPVMMVMVRRSRYTLEFLTRTPDFSVNWMSMAWTEALRRCGSVSGRDEDKFAATGMTAVAAQGIHAPSIAESVLTLECRTLYRDGVKPELFLDPSALTVYGDGNDYHDLFFGEVVAAYGTADYRRAD